MGCQVVNVVLLGISFTEGAVSMAAAGWKKSAIRKAFTGLLLFLPIFFPQISWAVQQHRGAEGLVSHQVGHFLFIIGMFYLLYRLQVSSPKGTGWFEFKLFVWLIIGWNFLTFYGHWHRELINPVKILSTGGKTTGFVISGPMDALFYFSRLDHLLLVPAFLCLLAALMKWRKRA